MFRQQMDSEINSGFTVRNYGAVCTKQEVLYNSKGLFRYAFSTHFLGVWKCILSQLRGFALQFKRASHLCKRNSLL
nr:hypothetical protein CFP56_06912 [Quercus suber]